MKMIQPKGIVVPGDNENRDMGRHGGIVGVSYFNVVWGFGFLPDSEYAKTYGVSTPAKVFVLAGFNGIVKDRFTGSVEDLPHKFQRVVDFQYLFAREMTPKMRGITNDGVGD